MKATERRTYAELKEPGDFMIAAAGHELDDDQPAWSHLWFACPCGCNSRYRLRLYAAAGAPRPAWDYDAQTVTLHPSVHIQYETPTGTVTHWHGWLRDGQWVMC